MIPPAHKIMFWSQGLMAHPMPAIPPFAQYRSAFWVYEPSAVLNTKVL